MDSEKETPQRPSYEESKPISIPGTNPDLPVSGQYGLKQNFFDPNKSSPGSWNTRLQNRLSYYETSKLCSDITA